jgi:hypothetical protein
LARLSARIPLPFESVAYEKSSRTAERQRLHARAAGQENTIDLLQRQARSLERILPVARAIADSRVA